MLAFVIPVLIFRSLVVEPFSIPSMSMAPTFMPGDHVVVSKLDYGNLGTFGFYLPKKVQSSEDLPQRGDIVVFKSPHDRSTLFTKRVIGTPGDKVSYDKNKVLIINNEIIFEEKIDSVDKEFNKYVVYNQKLNGKVFNIYHIEKRSELEKIDIKVPENHYFVMGDNRDNSHDSRHFGFIPLQDIIGKVVYTIRFQ